MNLLRRFLALFRRSPAIESRDTDLSRARARELREARSLVVAAERAERRFDRDNSIALAAEWIEAQQMGPGGLMTKSLSVSEAGDKGMSLKERFWELELSIDALGWQRERLTGLMEFSRYGIQQIMLMARYYYIKNPLVKRGVRVCSNYVFGRGFEISTSNDAANEKLQAFLAANDKELGHTGLTQKEQTLHTDGNVFFVFFDEPSAGELKVSTIDATEIMEIISNPDDVGEPWYFHRKWSSKTFDAKSGITAYKSMDSWYPALGVKEANLTMIGGQPVMKQPVLQAKYGGLPKWQFGCPDVYAAIDPARQYKQFLDNWAAVNQALARFAWDAKTKGGLGAIQNIAAVFATTLGNGGTQIEENPPPVMGSAFVSGPGTTLTPVKTGDKQGNPEQGRRILLMVAAAFGLPETFFGDASTGSLATAKSLDRPTELKFMERQQQWREILTTIARYALDRSAAAPAGLKLEVGATVDVTVKFPSILEHDMGEAVASIVNAATLGGFQPAGTVGFKEMCLALMAELGIENAETAFDAMYPKYDPKKGDGTSQPEPVDPATDPQANPREPRLAQQNQESRTLALAVSELRKASDRMNARNGHR